METDAIPTHNTCDLTLMQPYDPAKAEKQRHNAEKRLDKYTAQAQQQQILYETDQLDEAVAYPISLLKHRLRAKILAKFRETSKLTNAVSD